MEELKSPNISAPMRREAHETVLRSMDPKYGITGDPTLLSQNIEGPHGKTVHMHYGLEDAAREFPSIYRNILELNEPESLKLSAKKRLMAHMQNIHRIAASALF